MAIHKLRYKLDSEGVKVLEGCATACVIEEQEEAIKSAFEEVEVTIEVDDDWHLCKILAINNMAVEQD